MASFSLRLLLVLFTIRGMCTACMYYTIITVGLYAWQGHRRCPDCMVRFFWIQHTAPIVGRYTIIELPRPTLSQENARLGIGLSIASKL